MLLLSMLAEYIKTGKIVKVYLIHFRLARSLLGDQKQAFSMTNRKNGSFKRTLSQPLNIYTLDAITF